MIKIAETRLKTMSEFKNMPLGSCRLKWFCNTAIRASDFLTSSLFLGWSDGVWQLNPTIKQPSSVLLTREDAAAGWILHFNSGMSLLSGEKVLSCLVF